MKTITKEFKITGSGAGSGYDHFLANDELNSEEIGFNISSLDSLIDLNPGHRKDLSIVSYKFFWRGWIYEKKETQNHEEFILFSSMDLEDVLRITYNDYCKDPIHLIHWGGDYDGGICIPSKGADYTCLENLTKHWRIPF